MLLPRRHLSKKKRSQLSEKRAAKTIGGKVQPASGALPVLAFKGDVKSDRFLMDDKTTHAKSFSIALATWRKLSTEAWKNRRRPVMRICMDEGAPLYVIDEQTFLELT